MEAGFTITKQGWKLLAKLLAGDKLEISKIMVGSGKVPEGVNPGEITELVQPVALATSTVPKVADKQVSFIVEYRSDLNGGLQEGFWLNEFGVYANDQDEGEILLYYATMGDYPQYVAAYNGQAVDVRRYPVVIALSECYNVELKPPAGAWVTFEELAETLKRRGYHSNQNLLINGDFRKPVNRNGSSMYVGSVATLDMWFTVGSTANKSVTIENGYISFKSTSNDGIQQFIKNYKLLSNQNITLSILCKSSSSGLIRMIHDSGTLATNIPLSDKWILVSTSGKLPNLDDATNLRFQIGHGSDTGILDVIGVKLELGSVQTLAHKVEDETVGYDGWILNDPPEYDLQYALCSQYSPITGEFVGSQHSNPNLLDNAYWANKDCIINQRNQDEYTGVGYAIDRWHLSNSSLKLSLYNEYLRLTKLVHDTTNPSLSQWLENPAIFSGKTMTLSVLYRSSMTDTTDIGMGFIYGTSTWHAIHIPPSEEFNLATCTVTIPKDNKILRVFPNTLFAQCEANDYMEMIAAKLELGPVQTLAHQDADGNWVLNDPPPNKALELAKCQRYQLFAKDFSGLAITHSDNLYGVFIPTPVTMRTTPNIIGNPYIRKVSDNTVVQNATITNIYLQANGIFIMVSGVQEPVWIQFGYNFGASGLDSNL